jgi:hypothetical protein
MTGEFVRNAGLGMLGAGIGLMFVGMDWEAGLEARPVSWLGIPVMVGGMLLNFRGRLRWHRVRRAHGAIRDPTFCTCERSTQTRQG